MAAPVGIPPVHNHRSRIRDRCIRSSASRPMVDHHRMCHRIRHGPTGHSAQAIVGTTSGPVHHRNGNPHMGRLRNRPASRTRLRDHCHRVRRRMAFRCYRARPGHAATAANRARRNGDPGHSVVGAPPAPRSRQDRTDDTSVAVHGRFNRATRITDSISGRGCVGMDRSRHPPQRRHGRRRGRENTRDRIRPGRTARQRPRHSRRLARRPVHAAGHRERPARRACPLARDNERLHYPPGRTRPVRRRPAGMGPVPNGLALSDHVRGEQVELDFPDDVGNARLTGLAGREVAGFPGLARAGAVRPVADEGIRGEDLEQERGECEIGLFRGKKPRRCPSRRPGRAGS